jgi:hypothetical protein
MNSPTRANGRSNLIENVASIPDVRERVNNHLNEKS